MLQTSKNTNPTVGNGKYGSLKTYNEPYKQTETLVAENDLSKTYDLSEIKLELQAIKAELERLKPYAVDELLTMKDVCKLLKLSRPSVHTLIHKKKKLKPVQLLDQDFRFLRKDVEAMITESYKNLPGAEAAQ